MSGPQRVRKVIPFYGAENRRLFEIERRSMDRDGMVIERLNDLLPMGRVLDIGAGNGFTADALTRPDRIVIPVEPAAGMIDTDRALPWVQGVAQLLPFPTGSFDAAYATWAYFFPAIGHGDEGLAELNRVVRVGGLIAIADNAGEDEFLALATEPDAYALNREWWIAHGFSLEIIETSFGFDHLDEARELLTFYFGDNARDNVQTTLSYRVALLTSRSVGSVDENT